MDLAKDITLPAHHRNGWARSRVGRSAAKLLTKDEARRIAANVAKLLTKDEARRIAGNIAKLPELLQKP